MNAAPLLFLMPLLPLAGFLVLGLAGRRLPRAWVGPLACVAPAAGFAIALLGFLQVRAEGAAPLVNSLGEWMRVGGAGVGMVFTLDRLSAVLCLVVTGVGTLIHVYSIGYMKEDPGYPRFFAYLNLFMAAMLVLVLADNLALMFLGWEGVGLASYLLIGFWFEEEANAAAGRKAFVVNRIGDFAFLIGLFLAFVTFGSFRFQDLNAGAAAASPGTLTAIALLLFAGATGKSAQVPLYVWLPDAMAGPTPVSALIHAATMVTSGVYLVVRLEPLYGAAPGALAVVAGVGGLTAILAAFIALSQTDIKKVLAYSTVSQLGYMFLAAGLGMGGVAIFHLTTHAFFKALLFLGAGAVIHSLHSVFPSHASRGGGEQDLRRMGGLIVPLPRTFLVLLAGALAISGFPLLSGFFSKEAILFGATERALGGGILWVALWLGAVATAAMTSFYIFRLVAMAFLGKPRWKHEGGHEPHESPPVMMIPLYALAVLSIAGGFFDVPGFLAGHGEPHHWGKAILVFALSLSAFLLGLGGAWYLYVREPRRREEIFKEKPVLAALRGLSSARLHVDEIYGIVFVKPFRALSEALYQVVDRFLIDGLLVGGWGALARGLASGLRRVQSGRIPSYAAWFMAGAVALLAAMALGAGR